MKATKGVPKASRAPRVQQGRSLSDLKRLRDHAQASGAESSQATSTRASQPKTPGAKGQKLKPPSLDAPTLATIRGAGGGAPEATTHDAGDKDPESAAVLASDDRALFRLAMRFVRPLHKTSARAPARARMAPEEWLQARRHHAEGPPAPTQVPAALPARCDASATASAARRPASRAQGRPHPLDGDARQYLSPGCGPDLLRDLRRGKWPIQATLDLHGSTLDQARERMDRFLLSCLEHDIRCVRIVHGKGHGSRTGVAVLKDAVRTDLSRIAAVQAWAECNERDGGAGAVTALLRPEGQQPHHKGSPP